MITASGSDRTDAAIYLMGSSALDRQAYGLLLRQQLHLSATVESDFAPVGVWAAMRSNPDLALAVVERPSRDVRNAVGMIPRLRKQTRVLVVSPSVDDRVLQDWERCAIAGYVVKDGGIEELRPAISAVLAGGTYFSAGVREATEKGRNCPKALSTLSPRETELLRLLARGMKLREAASKMTVSYKTADSYRTSLLRKLRLRDRVELARYAIREGIIDP